MSSLAVTFSVAALVIGLLAVSLVLYYDNKHLRECLENSHKKRSELSNSLATSEVVRLEYAVRINQLEEAFQVIDANDVIDMTNVVVMRPRR